MTNYGPQTAPALATFKQKYCQPGETYRDVCNRIAAKLNDSDEHYHEFRETMLEGRFVPAGRILSTVGTTKCTTAYNCFVSGPIADSFVDDPGHIMQRATEAAATLRLGGGIGYDFSTLRPRGDYIRKIEGHSTGPVSFMHIFGSVGKCTASTGDRRAAMMAMLRVDHPDIIEFINAKQNNDQLNTFNLSVAITNEFMEAVAAGKSFALRFGGKIYREVDARTLWEAIMRSTWDWAEPGVIFIDHINHWNNLNYCEVIAATNPCSEQPLPPFGACLLGSFNLVKYIKAVPGPSIDRFQFDMNQLMKDVYPVVRAMDNVVDIANYPLAQQRKSAQSTRRMGLGVMGLANVLAAMGHEYGSPIAVAATDMIMDTIKNTAYLASAELAKEKGPFPYYSNDYLTRPFIQRLLPSVRSMISAYGIRNSHLTSVAPTGTISFCMDNVSSGIEPVFSHITRRIVQMPEGPEQFEVQDYSFREHGIRAKTADQVTAKEHIMMLATVQKHVDSAVSKTCNVPSNMAWEDFKQIYFDAWVSGCKGCATFQDGGKRQGVMEAISDCANGACAA